LHRADHASIPGRRCHNLSPAAKQRTTLSSDDAVRCDGQMSANSAAGTIERLLQ
jgi:hypothetical protein